MARKNKVLSKGQEETGKKKKQVHKKISKKDKSIEERTEGTKLGSNRQVI